MSNAAAVVRGCPAETPAERPETGGRRAAESVTTGIVSGQAPRASAAISRVEGSEWRMSFSLRPKPQEPEAAREADGQDGAPHQVLRHALREA